METGPTLERDVTNPADDRPGVLLRAPYNEELAAALKEITPSRDRRWVPELEGWWAAADHEEHVVRAALAAFGHVLVLGREGDQYIDRDGVSRQERLFG